MLDEVTVAVTDSDNEDKRLLPNSKMVCWVLLALKDVPILSRCR